MIGRGSGLMLCLSSMLLEGLIGRGGRSRTLLVCGNYEVCGSLWGNQYGHYTGRDGWGRGWLPERVWP